MDWAHIEQNWASRFREAAGLRWTRLSEQDLEQAGGRKLSLAFCLQRIYFMSPAEADRQISEWQRRQPDAAETQ